jgi:hypothetical protein
MTFDDIINDEIGRTYCKEHSREVCHICCMSFDIQNRMAEEGAGLRKKKTEVENAAEEKATAMYALRGMEQMVPRPTEAVWEMNREYLRRADEKLKRFEDAGEDVQSAMRKAIEETNKMEMEQNALMQGWSKKNPGKTHFEMGGPETQKLYDEILANPSVKTNRSEAFTCDYCNKSATVKLMLCSRCKKVSYCKKDCQVAAWKAHKKLCVPINEEAKIPKTLPLTWKEVEAHGGAPVSGRRLEVRAMLDESVMRQVFSCKDRSGVIRRIAAYTNSRGIPGLKQGSILRWKNPRYYHFMDGSSGARIEEEDLVNITVT